MTSPALQEIVALCGCPAAGNPAQYLFERAIEAAGLDVRFISCDVQPERIAEALAGAVAMGFRGCLLSGPLRELALPLVTTSSPAAAFAGAVGFVERRGPHLEGHIADGRGIVEALRRHVDPAGAAALVIGCDATGRAAGLELALAGATRLCVCDPDASRAASLAAALGAVHAAAAAVVDWQPTVAVPDDVRIVVLGQHADPILAGLRGDLVVADVALGPQPSRAAAAAVAAGGCLVDGLEIHAARTAIEFHALTSAEADADALREALDEFLS